jgi:hypothetical protein
MHKQILSIVKREPIKGLEHQPHVPRYNIEPGTRVLFITLTDFDPAVVKHYSNCMKECGATVDQITLDSTPRVPPEDAATLEAESIEAFGEREVVYTRMTNLMNPRIVGELVQRQGYDLVVSGTAGPLPSVPFRWARMEYVSREEFSSSQIDFPFELQQMIDQKVFDSIHRCEKVRITDPEGTDISFTNYDDSRPLAMAHEYGKPINFGYHGKEDCTGVIAGTLNHLGAFPHCKVYVKDSLVTKVEGGGRYGDVWREKLEKYGDIEYPAFPLRTSAKLPSEADIKVKMDRPGFFWYWECAIGTIPGVFRLQNEGEMKCFANFLHDRKRAGYLHHGFGGSNTSAPQLTKAGLPWTHVHIHNMFATYTGVSRDGSTTTVIDRGHLTALDDPDVRRVAVKFGNPDRLLQEIWIPAVPGINVKGDYQKDYAANPSNWIRSEAARHPILSR